VLGEETFFNFDFYQNSKMPKKISVSPAEPENTFLKEVENIKLSNCQLEMLQQIKNLKKSKFKNVNASREKGRKTGNGLKISICYLLLVLISKISLFLHNSNRKVQAMEK
jgi:hypothetical protein